MRPAVSYSSPRSELVVQAFALFLLVTVAGGHEHTPVTHRFDVGGNSTGPSLVLNVVDRATGEPLAARFTVMVDGIRADVPWVDENGIRFTTIHESKNQRYTAFYARGTGLLSAGLPATAKDVTVTATRGFEYRSAESSGRVENGVATITIELSRWVDLAAEGWIAVDEHLHFDRLDPEDDRLWLTMLEAEGLTAGHFMALKGGMTPGIWSRQFAYGQGGRASDEGRLLVPGQEYRDSAQGHINLLGIAEAIEPYSTGGMGSPKVEENFPPLFGVLEQARTLGALRGAAHGGTLGSQPTAMADAILVAVDFWEISNGFLYDTDNWYRLMNCGIFLPPAAGTDLPNSPYRDDWQPLLGSIRMYVHTGGKSDFESFKSAMDTGQVFITGGPIIDLTVNGQSMGAIVSLPPGGGTVSIRASLSSPYPLREFQLVQDGVEVDKGIRKTTEDGIHRWTIERTVEMTTSGWLAARGKGLEIHAQQIDARSHSNAIRILVGSQPIRSQENAEVLIEQLNQRHGYYHSEGIYETEADRRSALSVFERAIAEANLLVTP